MGAALLGIWSNQVREEPLPLFQPLPRRSLEYIELDEAYEQFGGFETVFVDTRTSLAFQRHHIVGAVSLPNLKADSSYPAISAALLGKTIIVYCSVPSCNKSERVAQLLLHRGHGRVLVMKAGFSGWLARGFPTE